jgi:hypothetical protein
MFIMRKHTIDMFINSILDTKVKVQKYIETKEEEYDAQTYAYGTKEGSLFDRKINASSNKDRLLNEKFISDSIADLRSKVAPKGRILPTLFIADENGIRDCINLGKCHPKLSCRINTRVCSKI